ncbi:MAG: tetratricopeptide repeat protein [Candidatus Riflebacteria bacterium]|nr:tetratricopeptide repeat protein [Candidatus Riflebacteria bacterium]
MTPDELLHLGQAAFEEGDKELAWTHLNGLGRFTLRDDAAKEVSRILLLVAIERSDWAAVLKHFETLKEKHRDLALPFDTVLLVGRAHREMKEFEQAAYVYRGIAEASFMLEGQLPGEWERAGDLKRAAAYTRSLIVEYPDLSVVQTAHLGLAQMLLDRSDRFDRSMRRLGCELLESFLEQNPGSPMADEATFALAQACLDDEQQDDARRWAEAGERRYPRSRLKDAFLYIQGWALFEKGDHERALRLLTPVAQDVFPGSGGQASESRALATYLIAQIHHTMGCVKEALELYRKVSDQFADARETAEELSRKEVACPEVTRVDPGRPVEVPVTVRNLPGVEVRAYKVDLMRLYLSERSLSGITKVNLAGIQPMYEAELPAPGNALGLRQKLSLALPFKAEGAYLVVLRGAEASTAGLVLVSDLSLAVGENQDTGRVRVQVQREPAATPVFGASVRVVGSASTGISSGRTDPSSPEPGLRRLGPPGPRPSPRGSRRI